MPQIIDENRYVKPSFARSVIGGLASGTADTLQKYQAQQAEARAQQQKQQSELANQMALQQQKYGFEKELAGMKHAGEKTERDIKQNEKLAPFQAGLQTLNRMREIRNKKNIGFGSSILGILSPETQKDRAEYETLGNSLISLASTIPIRNRQEFETLTGMLNDPNIRLDQIDGVLNAMERIITQNMQQFSPQEEEERPAPRKKTSVPKEIAKQKPPLSSFHR